MWLELYAVTLVVCASAFPTKENVTSRNVYLTIQNIRDAGYRAEAHHTVTEDGYILEIHRIPYKKYNYTGDKNRPVAFLMHGLLGASNSFTIYGPEYGMGYNLADAGYDVWLGNTRGTKSSRNHLKLDPDNSIEKLAFFNYTWEEIGNYDVAAMVNYILNYTRQEKLHYIGHSQGGTVFLVLTSMRPEYNKKFATVHLLGPVAYQAHFPNAQYFKVARFTDFVYSFTESLGYVELYPPNSTVATDLNSIAKQFCTNYPYFRNICETIGEKFQLTTSDIDEDLIGGASLKQLFHYGQNIRDKSFRRWNYGKARNLQIYASENPPEYDMSKVTAKTILHYTTNDMLVDERDILAIADTMQNADVRKVKRDTFLHEEFVTAPDAKELVTDYIIDVIAKAHQIMDFDESNEDDDKIEDESTNSCPDIKLGIMSKALLITFSLFVCNV